MRRLSKVEKFIIAEYDEEFNAYYCSKHGIFMRSKDKDDGKCLYSNCEGVVTIVHDIEELKEKYKKELNL